VEDFASQRQDRLDAAITSGFCSAAGRIALHDEYFGLFSMLTLTVGELPGECHAVECAFAENRIFGGLGGFARLHRARYFAEDCAGIVGVLFEELRKCLA